MSIGYVFLIIMASAAYFVSHVPTPDQMISDFQDAQKFYTSMAYDQALEGYDKIGGIESRFVDEDKVIVEFGDMQLRIKDATLYQSGNSYYKMAENELQVSSNATDNQEKEKADKLALEYVTKASDFFNMAQENTTNDELKVLSQNRIVSTWYLLNDYNKVIEEGRKLIERYPKSTYVQDALYNIGWAYYDLKEYEQSINTFNELVTSFPTGMRSDRALFQVGESYFDQGRYSEAVPYYQRLVTKMKIDQLTDIEIQRIQRDKLAGLTDETALDLAAKASLKIGACYGNSGNYQQAEVSYKRIATLFKYDKALIYEAYNRLANMYIDTGNFDAAIQSYRSAIDEVPDRIIAARMQVLICQAYFNGFKDQTFYERAIEEYSNYISAYNDVAFRAGFDLDLAFFWLGRSYYELGNQMLKNKQTEQGLQNIEQSIITYKRVISDFPATQLTERVYFYMGLAYQGNGSDAYIRTAIDTFNLLLKGFENTQYKQYIYTYLGRAYRSLKEYDTTLSYYNRIINEFPQSDLDAVWYEMGMVVTEQGNEMGSVEYYNHVSRKTPALFTTARLLSANTLYQEARDKEVIDSVTYAVEDTSAIESLYRLSQLYITRGNSYRRLGNLDSAIADYTKAYDLDQPQTIQIASVSRAGILIDQEQYERAETDLNELIKSDDESIRTSAQMRLAVILVRQGKSEQAISTYLDIYNSTEDIDEKLGYLRNIIQLNAESRNWEGIEKYTQLMITSDITEGKKPEGQDFFYREEAYYFLANSYETRGREAEENNLITTEAKNYYITAINYLLDGYEKYPDSYYSSDMLLKVGVLYLTKLAQEPDALDQAAMYFEDFIKKFSNTANSEMVNYYLGFCYYNGRRFTDAVRTFKEFARKYPNSEFTPEAIFYYADGDYNLGNMDEAINEFDLLISKYPKHEKVVEAYYSKGWAFLDLNRESDAIASFQALVDRFPNSEFAATALYSIADYYYNIQDYEASIANYQKVLENYPNTDVAAKVPETILELKETVAYIEYEKGFEIFSQAQDSANLDFYRQAVSIFEQIVSNYSNTESEIGALSNMGICYEALSSWKEAIDAYETVIKRYEEGAVVSDEAFTFAKMHRDYIVANRL